MKYFFIHDTVFEKGEGKEDEGKSIQVLITDREGLAKLYQELGSVIQRCEADGEFDLDIEGEENYDQLPIQRIRVVEDVARYYKESGLEKSNRWGMIGCLAIILVFLFMAISGLLYWIDKFSG